ncbi:HPF/RaiA family ribosome-associated protein [Autumnicola psychrophila]|uniref:HPF/RaiA family ribosome-associated protein n=1 Tax=Autumnicola psychrophila TaxID=3075592 RepID=A0ABU3DWJ2_9FLAO|nr:HPF/RaiA family ribosome-associated protein [Zunongwangia sp. F225]MDT0688082.1 HPF/RaiA family ribosome-associated protein [Zunongwangia sp. F225]
MTVDINCAEASCNGNLYEYVIKQLLKLEARYNWLKGSKVLFKDLGEAEGKNKICEIELDIPGSGIYVSAKNSDFKLAAKEAIKILDTGLRKRKDTLYAWHSPGLPESFGGFFIENCQF